MIDIDISHDHVIVLGVRINRPSGISVSQWYKVWERLRWKVK